MSESERYIIDLMEGYIFIYVDRKNPQSLELALRSVACILCSNS